MRTSFIATLVLCAAALPACGKSAAKRDSPAETTTVAAAAVVVPAPSGSAPVSEARPVDPAAAVLLGAPAPEFKVIAKPSAADIKAGSLVGSANGHMFEPKTVVFEPDSKSWRLILSDKPLEKPTQFIRPGAQSINISLPTGPVKSGQKFSKALATGDGYFQIVQPEDDSKTTSWNTKNAYYVEITKWDVKPYDKKAGMFQQAGTASGKVYVVYEPNEFNVKHGFKSSGVAGTFTNAVVRYSGEPKF